MINITYFDQMINRPTLVDVARDDFLGYVCQLALEVTRLNCISRAQTRPEVVSLQVAT